MGLNRIKIEGFKSIESLDLELGPLNVLIGANGSGKSNLLFAFRLLNAISSNNLRNFVATYGGPDSFLRFGRKETQRICIEISFTEGHEYRISLIPTPPNVLIIEKESAIIHAPDYDRDHKFWDFGGAGLDESSLHQPGDNKKRILVPLLLDEMNRLRVYHLNDTGDKAPVKGMWAINDNIYLRPDFSNLAAFLYLLQHNYRKHYDAIRDTIRLVAPFFKDFALRPNPFNDHSIQLEWHERGHDTPWLAHHLSDGTLRFICLATLLLQPNPPSTILIDEPELGLHPYALNVLAALMKGASQKAQIIIATQSVSLVSQFEIGDLLVVDRVPKDTTATRSSDSRHITEIRRLDEKSYSDWLEEYSVGELWEKNILGGRRSG